MQGQKQIYTFLMIIIFIMAFNFCRKAIKRDKELKLQREDALKRKIEADIIEQKLKLQQMLQEQEIKRQRDIADRMKEQKDKCYDLYIFANRPINEIQTKNDDVGEMKNLNNHFDDTNLHRSNNNQIKLKDKNQNKKNSTFSEPIIYLFVLVLIYFLMKAASDITQHFKLKSEQEKTAADDVRRYSLQDYAERRNSKAHSNRRSIFTSAMDIYPKPFASKSFEERRISRLITSDHIITASPSNTSAAAAAAEPSTPTKTANKPIPLLIRRCSVPAFSMQAIAVANLRRPSIDSFSEGESSPDIKRRVRMIHRH